MRLWTAVTFLLAALAGACSIANPSHCANNGGHTFCAALDQDAPFCSRCVADNNGCVPDLLDDVCDAGETTASATTTTATTPTPTTQIDPLTTEAPDPTSTSTFDPTTTSTTGTTSTSETTDTTSTTGETTDTSTTDDTTSDTTTGETTDTTDDTTGTTTESTTDTTDASTTETSPEQICGDNFKEFPETCDGSDLGTFQNCVDKNKTRYGGGTLKCTADCNSYDESACCLAPGQSCVFTTQKCCPGTTCKLLGGGGLLVCG